MRKTFYVSSIGGYLAQNVARCIREEFPSAYIIGSDLHAFHSGKLFVDQLLHSQMADSETFIDRLASQISEFKPDFYFPLNELELTALSSLTVTELDNLFGNTRVVWSGPKILNLFLNKVSTTKYLSSININTPTIYNFPLDDSIEFPLIIKPAEGSGSKGIYLCANIMEVNAALVFTDNPIIQQYIPGPETEYTVGVFARNGSNTKTAIFRRTLSAGGGTGWCQNVYNEEIHHICEIISRETLLNGSINVQLRKHGTEFYVFEINPRFSSTVYIRSIIGFREVLWSVDELSSTDTFDPGLNLQKTFGVYQTGTKLD